MTLHQPKSRARARQHGFSLIELCVALTLAAVLVGIAVPSFRGMMANNRLVTQTNDLIGALTLARSEAITRNSTMTFCRAGAAADTTCAGAAGNWSFWIVRNTAGEVVRRGDISAFGGSLRVTSTLTNDSMTYSSDGLARTGNPAVVLGTANRLRVCVSTDINQNIRNVTPGVGSRMSTAKGTGTC